MSNDLTVQNKSEYATLKRKGCRQCRARRHKKYYNDNKEQILGRIHKLREETPQKQRMWNKKSYENNKEKINIRSREYYYENRDAILEQTRRRRKENPGYWRTWKNKRARRLIHTKHTQAQIDKMIKNQNNKCYWCGKPLSKYHVDHVIPLAKGGSSDLGNLVVSCPSCNLRKADKSPGAWISVMKKRYKNENLVQSKLSICQELKHEQ